MSLPLDMRKERIKNERVSIAITLGYGILRVFLSLTTSAQSSLLKSFLNVVLRTSMDARVIYKSVFHKTRLTSEYISFSSVKCRPYIFGVSYVAHSTRIATDGSPRLTSVRGL